MEKKTISRLLLPAAALLFALSLASCDNDANDAPRVKCSPSALSLEVGTTGRAKISGSKAPYTAKSTNEAVAIVRVSNDTVYVTAVKQGNATIALTDAQKLTGTLPVIVKAKTADVALDKTTAEVAVGKTVEVNVKSGTAPYALSIKDKTIVSATLSGTKLTVKGVKAGTTTLTVTDKNRKTATLTVTVKA